MALKLYNELAGWYTLLTPPADYEEEARWYTALMREHASGELTTVLELGCGSGANASHMKQWFEMVVVDISEAMLAECRKLNPDLEQHLGDMRTFRLGRTVDAVFVHDAASYILTAEDLDALVDTATAHLAPGGLVLLCPDDLRENYRPGTDDGGSDGPDGRGVRYLTWSVPGADDNTVLSDYVYMLREADGTVHVEHERHVTGRLPGALWLQALDRAGFDATMVALEHSEVAADSHHVFIGTRRA